MADTKITALTAITTVDPAVDVLPIVDVSDTTMAASGTTKKITSNQILGAGGTATLASATITGDLTVDTSTLKVDSANNWVGVGTATPAVRLHSSVADAAEAARFSASTAILRVHPYVDATDKTRIQAVNGTITGLSDLTVEGLNLRFNTNAGLAYAISNTGVATWSNVGGVAGTAMTLNATGLGVGLSPVSGEKLSVNGSVFINAGNALKLCNASVDYVSQILNTAGSGQGNFAFVLGASTPMTLDASGNLLVGKTSSGAYTNGTQLFPAGTVATGHPNGTGSGAAYSIFAYDGVRTGDITQNGTTGVLYNTASDYRLKEQVQPLSGGLARVNALKPSVYKWKSDGSNGEGFLAHELAEVVPFAVSGEKDAVNEDGSIKSQGIDMSRVVPILVAAIQELTARVQTLETR